MVVMHRPILLLLSGLPLNGKSSFERQLVLLSKFLKAEGIDSCIAGPPKEKKSFSAGRMKLNQSVIDPRFYWDLTRQTPARGAILLGFADQFPFMKELREAEDNPYNGLSVFLWAQVSRPQNPEAFGRAQLVPLTEKSRLFLIDSGVMPCSRVIPHGCDPGVFHPIKVEARLRFKAEWGMEGRFVVGTVGAHTSRKRFDRIIETFSHFSKERKDGLLVIKTDRVMSMEGEDLDLLAKHHGVASKVRVVTEEMTGQQMCMLYNAMDVYLNLSEWEGFCIPVIEAMSCGVPIVTHPVQGPGEIVPYDELKVMGSRKEYEGKTMLLLADPDQAAQTLCRAASAPLLLKKLGVLGLEEAKEKYDIRTVAHRWKKLFQQKGLP
jgi:glycosyltransferase involved in cell wall biosynthesis